MTRIHNPAGIARPSSGYAHGVLTEKPGAVLHISGQVGTLPDGALAGDTAAQMQTCWTRILAILQSAGMDKTNIVKITAYLTDAGDVPLFRQSRDTVLDGHLAASTLLIVAGLADPAWTVEIEAVAIA